MKGLDYLFKPRSIAIIGASDRPLTIGNRIMVNLIRHGFPGPIYPVNLKASQVEGRQAYPTIGEVPGEVDLAHVIVPNRFVAGVLRDCAAKGVQVAIVNTSGFKETGPEGAALEAELVQVARETGIRVFGPNCQGVMNSDPEVSLYSNFTFAAMRPGHISVLAQGGGIGEVINNYFGMWGIGQRMYAANGNACDISIAEILRYYGDDPETRVIVLHMESFDEPAEFMAVASEVARRKPILALKSGSTAEGARAVSSHTGGLMRQDTTSEMIFDKCGVLRFGELSALCETAKAFATQPLLRGPRIGLVTNAGSPAIVAVDEAVKAGLEVPELAEETRNRLREQLQAIASVTNPIDMMATASGPEFKASLQALIDDANIDAILVCFVTPFFVDTESIAREIAAASERTDKPMLCVAMTNDDWMGTIDIVNRAHVPVFYFPEAAAAVYLHMDRYRRLRDRPAGELRTFAAQRERAAEIVNGGELDSEGYLGGADAMALLECYGVPVAPHRHASGGFEAVRDAAGALGYPVVLKAEAAGLVHKTEAGAVAVGLSDEAELEAAWRDISERLGELEPEWLLQPYLAGGVEVIVGAAENPGVGPSVMFGLGGIHVEVLGDVVFKLAPLTDAEAEAMLSGIRAAAVLEGVRGAEPVDREALAEVLMRVSQLVSEQPSIIEMDLNPILAMPRGGATCAVDARIRLARRD